jgi:hypothetical protein
MAHVVHAFFRSLVRNGALSRATNAYRMPNRRQDNAEISGFCSPIRHGAMHADVISHLPRA